MTKATKKSKLFRLALALVPALVLSTLAFAFATDLKEQFNPPPVLSPEPKIQNQETLEPGTEFIEKRTRSSKTHYLGNGKYAWDGTIGSIHYKDNPNDENALWKEIDTTIVDNEQLTANNEQYDYGMEKAGYHAYFKEKFNADKIVRFEKQGEWLEIEPQELRWTDGESEQLIASPQEVIGEVNENKIYWKDAYGEGLDFEWLTHNTRLEKHLIVKNLEDLPKPKNPEEAALELNLGFEFSDGVEVVPPAGGPTSQNQPIEFKNKNGETLWGFMPLRYWGSNPEVKNNEGQSVATLEKRGNKLYISIKVPYSWLQSAVYPVFIDTDVDVTIAAEADDFTDYSGSFYDNYLYAGGTTYHSGLRWTGVSISGTIGANSYMKWYAADGASPYNTEQRIYGIDQDNPDAPTNLTEFNADPLTDANVQWDYTATPNNWFQSLSLATIFQELVGSYTISNDALMLQIRGTGGKRIGYSDWGSSFYCELHIEYTAEAAETPTSGAIKGGRLQLKGGHLRIK